MEILSEYENLKLIKKYNTFYIRFSVGKNPFLCDLKISNQQALKIITNKPMMKEILHEEKSKINLTKTYFIDTFLTDYLCLGRKIKRENLKEYMDYFSSFDDIKLEMYNSLINGHFPETMIEVASYTAKRLYESTTLDVINSYSYLIFLRKDEKKALSQLSHYLK